MALGWAIVLALLLYAAGAYLVTRWEERGK